MTKQKPIVRVLSFLARAGVSAAFIAAGVGIYAWLYETRAQPPASAVSSDAQSASGSGAGDVVSGAGAVVNHASLRPRAAPVPSRRPSPATSA